MLGELRRLYWKSEGPQRRGFRFRSLLEYLDWSLVQPGQCSTVTLVENLGPPDRFHADERDAIFVYAFEVAGAGDAECYAYIEDGVVTGLGDDRRGGGDLSSLCPSTEFDAWYREAQGANPA